MGARDGNVVEVLNKMLERFLRAQPERVTIEKGIEGRQHIYVWFRRWLNQVLTVDEPAESNQLNDSALVQRRTQEVLSRLQESALEQIPKIPLSIQSTKTSESQTKSLNRMIPSWMRRPSDGACSLSKLTE